MSRTKKASKKPPKPEPPLEDMMERFHEKKICDFILTSPPKKKRDLFAEYRPKSYRECLNYNISQTDAKMDAGPTKIHVQQTRAEYEQYPKGHIFDEDIPPPTPKRKKRPSHGRGPVWLFLDEELKKKIDFEQEIYKREMEARLKRKIRALRMKNNSDHTEMLKRVGPDWFQELSPDQMNAVDDLPDGIKKDTQKSTIVNAQRCLARLGLVLRPNHHHVEIAMKNCCQNPVEFLLVLYQLMKPNRKFYSLNDRLLLSAVVHLSMRSILRELHIRIPSPPRQEERHYKKLPKKKPYIKYKSPYLVPYTFEPEPPKHTGKYENRHIQYPESQYFSYLVELKEEMKEYIIDEPIFAEEEFRINKKFGVADKIIQFGEVESVMTTLDREIDEELAAAQTKYNRLAKHTNPRKLLRPSVYRTCEKSLTLFESQKKCHGNNQELSSKCCGDDTILSLTEGVCITDQYDENDENIGTKYEYMLNIQERKRKFIIVGITIGKDGMVIPIIGGVEPGSIMDCKCIRKKLPVTSCGETENLVNVDVCNCEEKEREEQKQIEELLQGHGKCTCGPIPGNGSSSSTVSIRTTSLGSFVKKPLEEESDEGDRKEKLLEVRKPKPFVCGCQQMVDIALECAERTLEADEDDENKKLTFIIADTKLDDDKEPIPIISGVKSEIKCKCLEKYRRKIEKMEDIRVKQEVQDTLKSVGNKFLISGVTTGPDGKPIYILSGTSQERPCKKCEDMIEWKKREEERIANMPDASQLGQRFVIGGVHHSPVGNVYVLSGVLPPKECDCIKLYNAYMEKHSHCMYIYEKYLEKMKKETDEYLSEITGDENEGTSENENSSSSKGSSAESESAEDASAPSSIEQGNEMEDMGGACFGCNQHIIGHECEGEFDDSFECSFDEQNDDQDQEGEDEDHVDIKRFIVLDKIPCDVREQMRIIKRALCSMARDGFPLAKLPQAYKLPHFKLWMAMRCGKYWTMEDRVRLYFLSKLYWHHLDICNTEIRSPRLQMSNERAWKYTWASAKFIKKITNALIERHCRKTKQGIIDDGREFFPSMFDYQLPTKTFRDCYFAYVPGKEEAVFSNRPWKVFEYVDYKLIRIKKSKEKCIR